MSTRACLTCVRGNCNSRRVLVANEEAARFYQRAFGGQVVDANTFKAKTICDLIHVDANSKTQSALTTQEIERMLVKYQLAGEHPYINFFGWRMGYVGSNALMVVVFVGVMHLAFFK